MEILMILLVISCLINFFTLCCQDKPNVSKPNLDKNPRPKVPREFVKW